MVLARSSMRLAQRIRRPSTLTRDALSSQLEKFFAATVELHPSLRLLEFVRRFAARASQMSEASGAVVSLVRGSGWEIVALDGSAAQMDGPTQRLLARALERHNSKGGRGISRGPAWRMLGRALAERMGWKDVTLVKLSGASGEIRGTLCLIGCRKLQTPIEGALLETLARHAAVAIENARLLALVENSRRQWVEDFDAINDFIVVHDADNRVLRANRSLAESLTLRPTQLVGRGMNALGWLANQKGSEACPLCRNVSAKTEEFVRPFDDRTYLISTSRLRGSAEENPRTIHVLKDITDRRELERRYRELFDNIQEGVFFCTPEGQFLEVNNALVRMLGCDSRDELLSMNLFQLSLRPEERHGRLADVERSGQLHLSEQVLRRKDGTWIHTLQKLLVVHDAEGRPVQYRGMIQDVTEQKSFQAQLQRERDFNRNILNHTQSMILVLDTAGLVSYVNRRSIEAGYREEELLGHPLLGLVPASRHAVLQEALGKALSGTQVEALEIPLQRGNGTTGQFSIHLSPMRNDQGEINSLVVVMTDITDATLLQSKLMQTEKLAAVGQLVSGVAHEVNNPLAAILGFTDLLLENPDIPDPAKEELRIILQEAQRTKVIVQNLLSFARQMPALRESLQVHTLLRQTLRLRAYDFANHGVDVVEKFEEDLPELIGDAHQLQQVFLNILNNAYDALQEVGRPGRIEIETARDGGFMEIRFRDNGPGIAHPDRIFEPFFTTKEVGKGTGLGLSICYGIVRSHRGEVYCYNNPNGVGGTFVVRLPLAEQTSPAAMRGARDE